MNKKIFFGAGILIIVVVLFGGCIQRPELVTTTTTLPATTTTVYITTTVVTECGNGICESNENGFTCPEDCCVDGDGICPAGCTSVNDDDCEPIEVKIETIPDLMVGIHLEKAQDALGNPSMVRDAVNQIGCQLVSRGWDDHQFVEYSDYEDWSPVAQAVNDGGALFGAWQSVARIKKGFKGQDDLLTDIEFNDYTTRGADGKSYYTGDKWTYDGAIANEAYLDYLLAGTYAQIDAGADCIHYDEIGGGGYSSPEGKVGYDDYALGIANFCRPSSVIPTATADSYSGDNIPTTAVDGDTLTYWVSDEGGGFHWLEVNLSRSRIIRQITLSLHPKYLLTSYEIQYWDGRDWINLVTETANPSNHPSYLVHPVSTTKIRLYTTQQHARVAEFRVFGEGFRQHLIEKYGEDYDWAGKFKIDLTPGGSQCPDGTINSFNYRAYLVDHRWSGHNYGKNNPRGSDPAYYPSSNPLYSEWDRSPSYMLWSDTKLGDCDTGVGKCAQSFVPSADEEMIAIHLYLKANNPSHDLIVEIQSDNNNSPSGEILASATVPGKNYSTQGHYKRHPILLLNLTTAKGVVIEGKKKYWIVAHTIDGSLNEYLWQGSGDGAGAMQRLQGLWTPQPGGLFYEVWTAEDINTSFRTECVRRTISYLYQHTREYGDAEGKTVYVTANGIVPSSDYNDVGMGCGADLPRDDPAALRPHLDGTRVQISYWRQKKAQAQHINDVPTMMFLDYGFEGFPFQDLATQAEREAYLRIYVPEMYASGLLFSYPVKLGWGYKAYKDWNEEKTSTTYDAIVNQSRFLNNHFYIYKNVSINPMEGDAKVGVGSQWITPFNGDPLGEANEAKVSIALMDADDGSRVYLHVINHDWDSNAHRMREQTNIRFFVPLPSNTSVADINIISPDFLFKDISVDWLRESDGVYLTMPLLSYYNVVVIEVNPPI